MPKGLFLVSQDSKDRLFRFYSFIAHLSLGPNAARVTFSVSGVVALARANVEEQFPWAGRGEGGSEQAEVKLLTEARIGQLADLIRTAHNLVVDAIGQGRGGAVLVLLAPVQSLGTVVRLGLVVVAQVVLGAVRVVGQVDQVLGVVEQRTGVAVTVGLAHVDALLLGLVVVKARSAVPFHGHAGKALDVLVT